MTKDDDVIHVRFETHISSKNLKLILDRLQETGLECRIAFSAGCRIIVMPPKEYLRVERTDL